MESTSIIVVSAIVAVVVVVALARFKLVNFEAMWKGDSGLKLGASNQEPTVQRDISVGKAEARTGHLTATATQGGITAGELTAGTDIELVAGTTSEVSSSDPKASPPTH